MLATGAAPRTLPAPVQDTVRDRVLTLRTAADTARLRGLLTQRPGLVVVAGAGLIGTEAAGVLAAAGAPVTVVDLARRPMARQIGATVADWIAQTHRDVGVDLRTSTTISAVRASGAYLLMELDDGTGVSARAVLACLGVEPATGWLHGNDVASPGGGGVLVDAAQRVRERPGLYAVGDLAALPGPDGQPVRGSSTGAPPRARPPSRPPQLLVDLGILAAADLPTPAPL